jgi:protein SCO1/2
MKILACLRIAAAMLALLFTAGIAAADAPGGMETLPGDSIYRLDLTLVDQDGHSLPLRDLRGGPVLIAMFYTTCPYMCPLIIDTIKRTEHTLDERTRHRLRVVLVSFDSAHDTPAVLKAAAIKRQIDLSHWTLTRTDPAGVRRLAAALDVQYRALPGGGFNHSGIITLLDGEGRIAARTDKLGDVDPNLLAATQKTAGAKR